MLGRIMRWRLAFLARRLPVLAIRDFRILLIDRILAPASVAFSMVGVSFAVLDKTHGSTASLSYVLAAQIAPSLIFALVGGVIADRIAPQLVIVAGNVMIAIGEGTFGLLVLAGHPQPWQMITLEALTGTGMAVFYPASSALLPRVVPGDLLQEASAVSRLAMNGALMGGAVVAGFVVAAIGPGWALLICGTGLLGTVPLLLSLRVSAGERTSQPGLYRELVEGWSEVRSRTWLWVIIAQFGVVLMAWYGGFSVLGPVVARAHLGGPAAWGTITGTESMGLIAGGLVALRFTPRRPMLFIVLTGGSIAATPLALGMLWPVPLICCAAFGLGVGLEIMMVQWTVALAKNIPPDKLARVSSFDALGSVMAMPVGALLAGPIAAWAGVSATEYGAAALILVASALALLPREIRTLRAEHLAGPVPGAALGGDETTQPAPAIP
ncbi:MAG: MFS transporter [Actinobacteria bacterium]|nr:MFS transporter [Actinomycetota bacterium]MBO0837626.1 MFS transporter [Actinomycetota bacterium]